MILDDIVAKRKVQLEREKAAVSPEKMKELALLRDKPCRDFKAALSRKDRLSVISEVKKASPSKGLIQPDFNPPLIAAEYERAGADAISCLTEEYYFQGSSEYLKQIRAVVDIPILRKDFIFDPYQIYEARAIGADAILLIAAILSDDEIKDYYRLARDLGLYVLAESHSTEEFNRLSAAGCDIIGINNRNLKTFEVSLDTTANVAAAARKSSQNFVLVSESGIKGNEDMKRLRECGADAVLVGETLMRAGLGGIADCMEKLRSGV